MMPIYIDAVTISIALIVGIYVLVCRIKVLDRKSFSPMFEVVAAFVGMLAWGIYLLMTITAITKHPTWIFNTSEVWAGNYGYTAARVLMLVTWVAYLKLACKSTTRKKKLRARNVRLKNV